MHVARFVRVTAQRGEMRRYAGKTLEERDEERRARLLEAGLEVFGTVGYGASAIEVICSTARVATRDFYSLFGSKELLLRAVDDQIVAEATARINAEVKGTL